MFHLFGYLTSLVFILGLIWIVVQSYTVVVTSLRFMRLINNTQLKSLGELKANIDQHLGQVVHIKAKVSPEGKTIQPWLSTKPCIWYQASISQKRRSRHGTYWSPIAEHTDCVEICHIMDYEIDAIVNLKDSVCIGKAREDFKEIRRFSEKQKKFIKLYYPQSIWSKLFGQTSFAWLEKDQSDMRIIEAAIRPQELVYICGRLVFNKSGQLLIQRPSPENLLISSHPINQTYQWSSIITSLLLGLISGGILVVNIADLYIDLIK